MANSYYTNGQHRPRRNMPPPDYQSGKQASNQPTQKEKPVTAANKKAKPVKASDVAEATIQRADKYVDKVIKELLKLIKDLPGSLPITLSKEVADKIVKFEKTVTTLGEHLEGFKGVSKNVNNGLRNVLWFVAVVAAVCIGLATCSGYKLNEAAHRIEEADKKIAYADSVEAHTRMVMNKNDTCRDFGRWMLRQYGRKGIFYNDFLKAYNRKR